MGYEIVWQATQKEPVIIISSVTLGFLLYLILTSSARLEKVFAKEGNNTYWVIFQRITGVLFFGIIPLLFSTIIFKKDISLFGVSSINLTESLLWIAGLACVIIPMSFFATKKPDNLDMYPQIRKQEWSKGLLLLSAFTWIIYLVAYEYMFRGFLFLGLIPHFGVWTAFALNLAFYSLTHIPKGMKETIGAIPFGAIICLLTLKTGTIWIALGAHMCLALSNEWFSLHHHPHIKLTGKK
ncbi:MAG: CPBP family intramembrane metalloprotease [Bacteroidales bacterium]|nr:CPBP family intramembrane metalloprotease [Bacteroidales bacterium]